MKISHTLNNHFHLNISRCLSAIALLLVALLSSPLSLYAGQFEVVEVLDGDTVRASGHGAQFTLRLAGIDAPELCPQDNDLAQPFSAEAKEYLQALVLNKRVSLKSYGEKKYGILWGEIFLGEKNINLEMLQAGYAETYRGESPKNLDLAPYFETEKTARAAKKGIWAQGKKYISPLTWRKRQKARCSFATILYELLHQKGKK
jgi:micrococcal nuclease